MLRTPQRPTSLAVLTSGGDAAGMNPAIRAVVCHYERYLGPLREALGETRA